MGYATGSLPQAFDLVLASHVSLKPQVRARLDGLEAIGGVMLNDLDGVDVEDDSFDKVMAVINGDATDEIQMPVPRGCGVFPGPLRRALGGDIDAVAWRSVGMGVKQAVIHEDEFGTVRLLSIPAGGEMPKHTHRGMELTLVLQGAFRDEDGRFARGDLEEAGEETHHTPVAEEGADCICLVATDARLKFDGLLPRIAQPFIGI